MALSGEEPTARSASFRLRDSIARTAASPDWIKRAIAALVFAGAGSYLFQIAPTTQIAWVCAILLLTIYLFVFELVRVDVAAISIMVLLGLTVVLTHNIWVWDWPVLITIFGWMVLSKAVLYLLATPVMNKIATTFIRDSLTGWIRGTGVVIAILGAILVYKTGLGRFY